MSLDPSGQWSTITGFIQGGCLRLLSQAHFPLDSLHCRPPFKICSYVVKVISCPLVLTKTRRVSLHFERRNSTYWKVVLSSVLLKSFCSQDHLLFPLFMLKIFSAISSRFLHDCGMYVTAKWECLALQDLQTFHLADRAGWIELTKQPAEGWASAIPIPCTHITIQTAQVQDNPPFIWNPYQPIERHGLIGSIPSKRFISIASSSISTDSLSLSRHAQI